MSSLTPARFARSAFWVTLAFLVLELALWLALPRILDAAFPEAEARHRWVSILQWTLCFIWIVWLGVLFLLRLARTRWMQRLLGEGRDAPGPIAEALAQLEQRFDLADSALRKLGPLPGGRPRPWLLMLGAKGAGKSAAVRGSELSVFVLDTRNSPFEVSPTHSCDWLHCGDAVILDTCGRYMSDPLGRAEWIGLLRMVARRRAGQVLDGVVVTVNLTELVQQDGAATRLLGERLRRQLDDLVELFGYTPPAHLLLTHVDGLEGFHERFRKIPGIADHAWGYAFPAAAQAQRDLVADFEKGFAGLLRSLEASRHQALSAEQDHIVVRKALLLPAQLGACSASVAEIVGALTGPTSLPNRVPLVGFWLASARGQAARIDLAGQELDAGLGLQRASAPPGPEQKGQSRPHFLKPLFASLFIMPGAARLMADGERKRRERKRRSLYAAAMLAICLGGVTGLWYSVVNFRHLGQIETQLKGLQETLGSDGVLTDPSSLARALVLGDLALSDWPPLDDDTPLLTWAYRSAELSRPGWLRDIVLSPSHYGLRDGVADLLTGLARERVVEPSARLLVRELEELDKKEVPDLHDRREGRPLSPSTREWATQAWLATELSERWTRLSSADTTGGHENEALDDLRARTAEGIGALLERVRGSVAGGRTEQHRRAGEVEALLARRWFTLSTPDAIGSIVLPDLTLVGRVRGKLDPVGAADLLYSVALEETTPPSSLDLQSSVLSWSGSAPLSSGPHGFTIQGCQTFETALVRHETERTFVNFKADSPANSEALTAEARRSYSIGHLEQWSYWLDSFDVSSGRGGHSLPQMPEQIYRVYRVGDGDLERIITRLGRGEPMPQPKESKEESAPVLSAWCACQAESWWAALALTATDGSLHQPFADLQAAMSALADTLQTLPQDASARLTLVRDTFAQKGVLAAAARANAEVLRALESGRAPGGSCANEEGEARRRQQIRDLVEQVNLAVLNEVWWILLQDYAEHGERAWNDEVLSGWSRLRKQYPLDLSSNLDADPDEIREMVGAGGAVDKYIAEWLAPLLDMGVARPPLWQPAPHLQLTDVALTSVRRREDVGGLLDRMEGPWDVTFQCAGQPRQQVGYVTGLVLSHDGDQLLECIYENTTQPSLESLSASSKLQVSAVLQQNRSERCLDEKYSGDWAFYRFLQRGYAGRGSTRGELRFSGRKCETSWGYSEGREGPYATLLSVSRLGLPEQILVLQPLP